MKQMKQRALRKWLTEIATIVFNPAIDPYTAHAQIKGKLSNLRFERINTRPEQPISRLNSTQLLEIDAMLKNTHPTEFASKIFAIKKVRQMTGLGLKEA